MRAAAAVQQVRTLDTIFSLGTWSTASGLSTGYRYQNQAGHYNGMYISKAVIIEWLSVANQLIFVL